MGRTLATANQMIQKEMSAFGNFKRALRKEDQALFETLFVHAKQHTAAISLADHALPLESILLAMLLEQQREIEKLKIRLGMTEKVQHSTLRNWYVGE